MRQPLILSVLALLLLAPAARAATHNVTVNNFEFNPAVVDIQVGDTVVWTNTNGIHSVTSDDGTFAATTNVELTVTVTDTQTGRFKVYTNPLGKAAAPVQDTNAFDTCP